MKRFATAAAFVGARVIIAGFALVYAILKLLPQRNKIVLVSRLYARTSQDFQMVRAEIQRQDPSAAVVILNDRNTSLRVVPRHVLTEMYHLATARACITDSYLPPISVLRHRDSLVIVQMWHALGAIKRFGLAALDTPEGRSSTVARAMHMHRGYDWVIAGGRRMVEPFAEAFGVEASRVLPIGTPRVDLLLDTAYLARLRAKIRAAHPELGSRPVLLYAPTFRKGVPVRVEELLDALAPEDLDVVVALHPLDRRDFSDRPGVVQDRSLTTLDWLTVADHVVSDYSAIVFDAAVLGIPLYFYVYDLDEYRDRRGLFFDYEQEMPGPVSRDARGVVAAIRSGAGSSAEVDRFRKEFLVPLDGGCTRRIVELALGADPEELS